MRVLFYFFLCCVVTTSLAMTADLRPVSDELEALRRAYAQDGKKGDERLKVVAKVTRTIQQYVRGADENDWATPSKERLRRLGQVATIIQPYTSLLIDLGTPTESGDSNPNALGLLYFARPTIELKNELIKLTNTPKAHGAAATAYGVIFNLGMGTSDVRDEVVKRMSEYNEDSYKSNRATGLFYAAGAEWRMPEAVPFYVELLQRDARNNEQLHTRVRAVATAVRPLGQEAAAVLPLLQEHLARMKAENVDPQTIGVIESAIRAVEGKEPIEPLLCVSGAGPVSEGGIRRSDSITPAASTPTTPTAAPQVPSATPAPSPLSTPAAESPAPVVERKSPVWPWLVGIVALVVIVALALKRRA